MKEMTSLERVLTTLGHQEPDRVPLFLLLTMHGARELGLSLKSYLAKGENIARGQLKMLRKYRHDCLYSLSYAPVEIEAWGGEVIFHDDGPPNSGEPLIKRPEEIKTLEPPLIEDAPRLQETLKATALLKAEVGDKVPIIGVAVSPFSLPVMQMGFEPYLELMAQQPELFGRLMAVNTHFCVNWANAQLKAGATAIGYFDPLSSTTITTRAAYLETCFKIARRALARIKGPTATHLASGRCLPIVKELAETGTAAIGVSTLEDLAQLKAASRGKLALMGNLNGIEMRRWTAEQTVERVKEAIAKAGPGGGFILSDNHGEIPFQVPEEVLMTISETVNRWGRYPLDWAEDGD